MAFSSVAAVAALDDLCCSSVAAAGCVRIEYAGYARTQKTCLLYLLRFTLLALLTALHTTQRMPIYDRTSHFAERGMKGADFFFYTRRSACPYTIAPHISLRGGLRALNFRPRRRRRFCERQSPRRVVKRLCERPRCPNTTLTLVL